VCRVQQQQRAACSAQRRSARGIKRHTKQDVGPSALLSTVRGAGRPRTAVGGGARRPANATRERRRAGRGRQSNTPAACAQVRPDVSRLLVRKRTRRPHPAAPVRRCPRAACRLLCSPLLSSLSHAARILPSSLRTGRGCLCPHALSFLPFLALAPLPSCSCPPTMATASPPGGPPRTAPGASSRNTLFVKAAAHIDTHRACCGGDI
jgi:hypothetical protein